MPRNEPKWFGVTAAARESVGFIASVASRGER